MDKVLVGRNETIQNLIKHHVRGLSITRVNTLCERGHRKKGQRHVSKRTWERSEDGYIPCDLLLILQLSMVGEQLASTSTHECLWCGWLELLSGLNCKEWQRIYRWYVFEENSIISDIEICGQSHGIGCSFIIFIPYKTIFSLNHCFIWKENRLIPPPQKKERQILCTFLWQD